MTPIPPLILAVLALVVPLAGGAAAGRRVLTQEPETVFLGFRLGEEARYALESDPHRDREVHWSLTLQELDESRDEGTFEMSYVATAGGQRLAQAIAEARFNAYGFPLGVRFTSERTTIHGAVGYTIDYRFEQGRLRKELAGGAFDDQEIDLDELAGVNPAVPRGLFLFTPLEAECTRAFAALSFEDGAPTGGGRDEPQVEAFCRGRELIFANPGLLGIAMPTLWEAGTGVLDFFVLAPTGMRLDLLVGASPGASGGGLTVGGLDIGALLGGGPDPFDDGEDALQRFGLRSGVEPLRLDIGGRMVDAWRLDPPPPFAAVYVDGTGSIVRLDLPDDGGGPAWIRRLRPSEF